MAKIAVAYDNGQVFQHFGKTTCFKIYETGDDAILSSRTIETGCTGHEALADLLAGEGIDVLICGRIGAGAVSALTSAGISICAGAAGDADQAVEAYLRKDLNDNTGIVPEEQGEAPGTGCGGCGDNADAGCGGCGDDADAGCGGCGDDADAGCGGCGGGCGGCSGCGGEPVIILEGRNAGKTCTVHYRGTYNDGTQFDSSYDRGEPMTFLCGAGMMISGFDKAVVDMEPGQTTEIHLTPEEAYGMPDPRRIVTVEISTVAGSEVLQVGQHVELTDSMGRRIPVTVTDKDETTITFDTNHPMAGKELHFVIELLSVE